MNIQEYISTGILEAYVMGDLSAKERAEVESNLLQYPELQEELSRIETTSEEILMKSAIKPREKVKARILNAVSEKKEGKVVPMGEPDNGMQMWRYATAASVVIAITSTLLAFRFWDNWKRAEGNLQEVIAQNVQIASDYNVVNERLDKIEDAFKVIDNPAFLKVVMKGTANAPEAMASVYWNDRTQESYLSVQNLKVLAQEKQYQLWAIIDGKPVDMGVFDAQTAGLIKMKNTSKAAAFAVTIEPRGGKASPTMETMQVLGNS